MNSVDRRWKTKSKDIKAVGAEFCAVKSGIMACIRRLDISMSLEYQNIYFNTRYYALQGTHSNQTLAFLTFSLVLLQKYTKFTWLSAILRSSGRHDEPGPWSV